MKRVILLICWIIALAGCGQGPSTPLGDKSADAVRPSIKQNIVRIPIRVPDWSGRYRDEIITAGVPLAKGTLVDEKNCRLLNEAEKNVPFVGSVLARWPDRSVKWLLLDFPARVPANGTTRFILECGTPSLAKIKAPIVTVAETLEQITVSTGPLRFCVNRRQYTVLDGVWVDMNRDNAFSDEEAVIVPGKGDGRFEIETTPPGAPDEENWLRNAAGGPREVFKAVVTESVVEFQNHFRAVILIRGEYRDNAGKKIGPFWTRYTARAGSGAIGVEHFFAFDADVGKSFLRSLSFGLEFSGKEPLKTSFGLDTGQTFTAEPSLSETALVEVMPDRIYNLVPLSADRRVKWQVVGKSQDGADQILKEGVEAEGWVSLENEKAVTTIALRDFPRLHPKEIRVEPGKRTLRYYLWPERGGKVLDLRRRYKGQRIDDHYDTGEYGPAGRGFGKTHQMTFEFRPGKTEPGRSSAFAKKTDEPLHAFCESEHYASCDIWNRFQPVDTNRFPKIEAQIRLGTEWALRLPRLFHWDGIADWGDTMFHQYEMAQHNQIKDVPKTSWVPRGYDGWFNNDCNVSHDFMIFFFRSMDDRIYRYWERMVQHIMDVDTIHCSENPTEIGGGRRHDEQHWGSSYTGYGTAAVEAGEMYFLTGSLWAKEMLRKYADWYMVGGGSEWPTRLPCLVLAWEATGDKKYMDFILRPASWYDYAMFKTAGSLDMPNWRTQGIELGVEFMYRATDEKKYMDHLVNAARTIINTNPGNGYALSILARAYLNTGDREILDWMRRLLVTGSPYGRAMLLNFWQTNQIPENLASMPFEDLTDLYRKVSAPEVRGLIYTYRYYPYAMAAMEKAGLDEKNMELIDFALDRCGMNQFHCRGPDVPEPKDAHYEPMPLDTVVNCNPLADPFGRYTEWKRNPLKPGEIGFDFGEWGEYEPGFLPVRPATVYPYRSSLTPPFEHDGVNLIGLPFGATLFANNMPFRLPEPAFAPDGKTMVLVGKGEKIKIPVNKTVRRLYVLGHVCVKRGNMKETGARYHLNYADGSSKTIDMVNMEDYENVFNWGFSKKALFARNWKIQGGWDGGAPILNNYPIACEDKPLKDLVIDDIGQGIGFMILAVTAEVSGMQNEKPVLEVSLSAPDSSAPRWKDNMASGWLDIPVKWGEWNAAKPDETATFRLILTNGLYDLELEMKPGGGWSVFNVRANGRRTVRGYVPTSGCVPGVTSRTDRIRFPVRVDDGKLDIGFEAERTVGTWRHPARFGFGWPVSRVRVFSGATEPSKARTELAYGWVNTKIKYAAVPLPWEVTSLRDARLQSAVLSQTEGGAFRADLKPGDYEVELIFALRGERTRERPVRFHVALQGTRVLTDFDGGAFNKPEFKKFPITVGPDGQFLMTIENAAPGTDWGISALIVRPKNP